MNSNSEADSESSLVDGDLPLDTEQVIELLVSQSEGICEEIVEVARAYEEDGKPPTSTVNSIRTEVMELQNAVEDFVVDECEGAEPWEHANELGPLDRHSVSRNEV